MIALLIIADDLTGANDTGVQLAKRGIPTFVTIDPGIDFSSLAQAIRVLVVDTESRHIPAPQAAQRVEKITQRAREQGVKFFYKKTDSTLRGNIGAELEAALRASHRDRLVFVPAFPGAQRFTRQGTHYVGAELLHTTEFGQDPLEPLTTSSIPEILQQQTNLQVATVFLDAIRRDEEVNFEGGDIIVCDGETRDDLRRIGEQLQAQCLLGLTAGSAGFAGLLPDLLQLSECKTDEIQVDGPVLIINGSLNSVSLKQVEYAEKTGVNSISISPEDLLRDDFEMTDQYKNIYARSRRAAEAGEDLIIRTTPSRKAVEDYLAAINPHLSAQAVYKTAASHIGIIVANILRAADFPACAVFGGDTLLGIMEAMSFAGIRPRAEITSGTVLSEVEGAPGSLHLISKAGGFGEEDVIIEIIEYIRGRTP